MRTRREFLKLTGNLTGLVSLSTLGLPLPLFAGEDFTDYKALVVVLQHGGNDALNMLIPSGNDSLRGYDNYASIRTTLAVQNNDLSSQLTDKNAKLSLLVNGNPYAKNGNIADAYLKGFYKHNSINGLATNGLMPEFAHLVEQGKVAMIANVGNLIAPATKSDFLAKSATLPPFLFAHNNQRDMVFNGIATSLKHKGWAGRMADNLNSSANGESIYGMNLSLGGKSHFLYGNSTSPLVLNASGPVAYKNIIRSLYDEWLAQSRTEKFKRLYNNLRKHSFDIQDMLVQDWNNAPDFTATNAYGEELFSLPNNTTLGIGEEDKVNASLLQQLKAVAKLAKIGKDKGLKRQLFFVVQGGYDTHSNQQQNHAKLLRALSLALGDFQIALQEIGMEDEVTTFNISDFGRTTGNNGDGTDHAWGTNCFAMGGAVKGGFYGTLPDLTLGGDDDISSKGRIIPTTSYSQYFETIVQWFGADETLLNSLFPERNNFAIKDLGFMV